MESQKLPDRAPVERIKPWHSCGKEVSAGHQNHGGCDFPPGQFAGWRDPFGRCIRSVANIHISVHVYIYILDSTTGGSPIGFESDVNLTAQQY